MRKKNEIQNALAPCSEAKLQHPKRLEDIPLNKIKLFDLVSDVCTF